MNLTLILGLILGFAALIGGFTLEGGALGGLFDKAALIIVFGGTIGATLVSNPMSTLAAVPKAFLKAIVDKKEDLDAVVATFVALADKARREGLLALEEEAEDLEDPFMKKGITLLVDGTDPEIIQSVLESDVAAMKKRHEKIYSVFEQMGGYAPTIGILGAVMGLINVLSHLENPEDLGHGIAVAFVATLYGVGTANLIYLPIYSLLKSKSKHEAELREMMLEGVLSIQAGDNPRIVQERLEAFMPASARGRNDLRREPADLDAEQPAA